MREFIAGAILSGIVVSIVLYDKRIAQDINCNDAYEFIAAANACLTEAKCTYDPNVIRDYQRAQLTINKECGATKDD